MRVMVTGATTPLGVALIDALLARDATSAILAIGHEAAFGWDDSRVTYRAVDLRRWRDTHDLLFGIARDLEIEAVVHAAQHRDPRHRGRSVHAQNVDSTRWLLDGCAVHPTIRTFVYRSFAEVYAHVDSTVVIDESAALEFAVDVPQWTRDRVEADLAACAFRSDRLRVVVLRFAEILAPSCGSQLHAMLSSHLCLRPFGFDPMINVLSLDDAVRALLAALDRGVAGVFNIPGLDTLPLSHAILESNRASFPVPGARYRASALLDGTRARRDLGFEPHHRVRWPT